jgi:hypothetical protein
VVFDASDDALEFGDNAKANFGDSSDLQIYHDSNNSKLHNTNNGQNLILQSDYMTFRTNQVNENILLAVPNGSVKIYHNGNEKIETTATGCDITGTAVTDGLTVAGTQTLDGTSTQTVETLSAASTVTIDCSTGNFFTLTAGQNTTFAFSNIPASGNAYVLVLQVAVATYSLTWPSAVKWSSTTGGSAPTLTANKVNNFVLVTSDGGTTWRGSANTDYAS